jgi:hypothetical protein
VLLVVLVVLAALAVLAEAEEVRSSLLQLTGQFESMYPGFSTHSLGLWLAQPGQFGCASAQPDDWSRRAGTGKCGPVGLADAANGATRSSIVPRVCQLAS